MAETNIRMAMLSTGEEVLLGDITDTNAAWLSRYLFEQGYSMHRRVTVGDQLDDIAVELVRCSQASDVVIVNGGLGPTTDDLTTAAMATAMNVDLVLNEHWLAELKNRFEKNGRVMAKSNLKQAMLPEGSEIIDNPKGSACGFYAVLNNCHFFFTPGVPSEFEYMVETQILPKLRVLFPSNAARECHRLFTFGLSESGINDSLSTLDVPENFDIGYRSSLPFIEMKLFSPVNSQETPVILDGLREKLGSHVVSENQTMLEAVRSCLSESQSCISIAEQFTGGWVTNWLNQDLNTEWLKSCWVIPQTTAPEMAKANPLAGALAMASSAQAKQGVALGLACGPMINGTVSIALSTPKGDWGQKFKISERHSIENARSYIATAMLDMVRRYLGDGKVIADYASVVRVEEIFIAPDNSKMQ